MPICKRCDQRVTHEEEHYNDGVNEDGDIIWEIAGWNCEAVDWRSMFKAAELDLRLLKSAVNILYDQIDHSNPNCPVSAAMTKAGLNRPAGEQTQDIHDEEDLEDPS